MSFVFALVLLLTNSMSSANLRAADSTIVVFKSQDAPPYNEALEGFKESLQSRGVQANVVIRSLIANDAKAIADIEENLKLKPDLVLTLGSRATKMAAEKISTVPIVSGMILQSELLNKGGNITGIFLDYSVETQFAWLQRFLPDAKTIGVIYNPEENQAKIDDAKAWAQKSGFSLIAQNVSSPREIPPALELLGRKVDVLWGIPDKLVFTQQTAKEILLFSFRNRIPFIGLSSSWVKAGALYALDWNYRNVGKECGDRAVAILQGTKADPYSPDAAKGIIYSLNLKAAERMKIAFPAEILKEAMNVY